jgi:signal transduction histidine kinase
VAGKPPTADLDQLRIASSVIVQGLASAGVRRRRLPRPGISLALVALVLLVGLGGTSAAALLALSTAQQRALDAAHARVDRGLASARRAMDDRTARLGDQAQLLATQPAVVDAVGARDQQALGDLLAQARSQFGTTTAAAIVDEKGRSLADQPARAPYDYTTQNNVRRVLSTTQPLVTRAQTGIEGRPVPNNPLNDLSLAAAFPVVRDGKPIGAVVLMQALNDGFMQSLSDVTGLDVAVLTSDTLIAGSRDVRALFQPPHVRPPNQQLAPVGPTHQLGDATYVAASEAVRSWGSIPAVRPVPTPAGGLPGREPPGPNAGAQGPPVVATLFVGQNETVALGQLLALRQQLALLLGTVAVVSLLGALLLGGAVRRPLRRMTRALYQLDRGVQPAAVPAGLFAETAAVAEALDGAGRSATDRVQTLRDEVRKLEAVIDSVAEGIVVLDERSRLVTINDTAQRLLGLPGGVPAGTDLQTVLSPAQWRALEPAVCRRDRVTAEISFEEPKQAIVRVAAVPVHDDYARALGRAIVLQDVTEERLLDNVKADFFTAMSHELRTPLSAIKGAAEVLLDDEVEGPQRRFVETIHRNADRLGRLVTDLLDLGKLESGRVELRLAPVDLNEVVADVVAALQAVAERGGVQLVVRGDSGPLTLLADHGRVEQIVTNLVSNACQYTPEGGEVTVSTWRAQDEVYLAVSDNGIGISTVDQQHLFDKFYQGVNTLTHKRGGSGLGLTIVKHLAELHGGHVAVQSKLGSGTTFTVRLPAAPSAVLPSEVSTNQLAPEAPAVLTATE